MLSSIKLTLRFKTLKKLCIGSGGLALKVIADINFVRINDKILIPASTIKGVLRTSMIKVAPLLGYNVNPTTHPTKINDTDNDKIVSLLGKPNKNGKVRLSSAILDKSTFVLTHVTIDDKCRVANEGNLFSIEYLPKGVEFISEVKTIDQINIDEARLLFAGIMEMNNTRLGKGGLLDIRIKDLDMPDDLKNDKIIKMIMEDIKV